MKTNNTIQKETSCIPLRFKPYFYEVLDSDFDVVCEVIANKGAALKELVTLFEKEGEWRDIIIPIVYSARSEYEEMYSLSEKLGISHNAAYYLMNRTFEELCALDAKNLKKMLDDYIASTSKIMVDIHDYDIKLVEEEILMKFDTNPSNYEDCDCLLSLRKDMINKKGLKCTSNLVE